ncbi:MAG: hypothetical protein KGH87_08210 [Thaumarchaeota archaeon]|nr:hypothetical protein [Nitrososphaerota archaeon]MDE1839887.1 hypothetical protein [Nitrososphaerota archaeon]
METLRINNITHVKFNCPKCNKETIIEKRKYDNRLKNSKRHLVFCSLECSNNIHIVTDDMRERISKKQRGISVMSRGRPGHITTEETRRKISLSKTGQSYPKDWNIILEELQNQKFDRSMPLIKPVPDAIMIKDGKVIALEVEKETGEYGIRDKMKLYENVTYFDQVIIVWYRTDTRERVGEFHKVNGVWSDLIPTPVG